MKHIICARCGKLFNVSLLTQYTPIHETLTGRALCSGSDKRPRADDAVNVAITVRYLERELATQRTIRRTV